MFAIVLLFVMRRDICFDDGIYGLLLLVVSLVAGVNCCELVIL